MKRNIAKNLLAIILFVAFMVLGSKNVLAAKVYSLAVSGYPTGINDRNVMHDRISSSTLEGYSLGSAKEFNFNCEEQGKGTDINAFNNAIIDATGDASSREDIFFFFFSGHSFGDQGITLAGHKQAGKVVADVGRSWKDLAQIMASFFPGEIIVILDCCHSEKFYTNGVMNLPSEDQERFHCLLSCAEEQTSQVYYNFRYGILTHAIGVGLGFWNGDVVAANSKGIVTLQTLYNYVKDHAHGWKANQKIKKYGTDITLFRYPVSFNSTELKVTLYPGQTKKLKPYVAGCKVSGTWKTSNKKVVTVNSKGKITAKKTGTANITITKRGTTATCKVTVKKPSIKLNKTSLSITVGGNKKLKATIAGKSKKATWKTSNKKVATVNSSGKITAKGTGNCKITATCNGVSASCKVTVKEKEKEQVYQWKVGDYVNFGNYPQHNALDFSSSPIKWKVVKIENNCALLMSVYILDSKPYNAYNETYTDGTSWETCTLRNWLNSTFLNKAFSSSERKRIIKTLNNNNSNGLSANPTYDYVFLPDQDTLNNEWEMAYSTEYARSNNKLAYRRETVNFVTVQTKNGNYSEAILRESPYWLRGMAADTKHASAMVYNYSKWFISNEGLSVNIRCGIRPVISVKL